MGLSHEPHLPLQRVPLRARSRRGNLQVLRPGVQLMLSGLVCMVARGWTQMSGPLSGQEEEASFLHGARAQLPHLREFTCPHLAPISVAVGSQQPTLGACDTAK